MTRFIQNPKGNLMSYCSGPNDGHGGHAAEHREEMRAIAVETINEIVPAMCAAIYNEAVTRLVGAIQYDVETCVSVSIDSMGEIFNSKKFQTVLSENIMKAIMAHLDNNIFKI